MFDGNRLFDLLHLGHKHSFVEPLSNLGVFCHDWLQLGFKARKLGYPDAVVNFLILVKLGLLLHGAEFVFNEEHLRGIVLHSHSPDLFSLPVVQIFQRLQRRLLLLLHPWSALR